MSFLVVSPLSRMAECCVRHRAGSLLSLVAHDQQFHRPACIRADRHRRIHVNDVATETAGLVAPAERHVLEVIDFARLWDRQEAVVIHCWMGISRSPAAALIAALAVDPEQDDARLVRQLRSVSPASTPNPLLVEIADGLLSRGGALERAVAAIGRGAEAGEGVPFVLPIRAELPDPADA